MEYCTLCVTHYLKIFTQPEATRFLSTVKRARSSPREEEKEKSHHIFIRFLEARPLKIVQVLQFITCKFMGLGNNAVVSRDGGRGGVFLVNLFFFFFF